MKILRICFLTLFCIGCYLTVLAQEQNAPPIPSTCKDTLDINLIKNNADFNGQNELLKRWKKKYPDFPEIRYELMLEAILPRYTSFERNAASGNHRSLISDIINFHECLKRYGRNLDKYESLEEVVYLKRRVSFETYSQVVIEYYERHQEVERLSADEVDQLILGMEKLLEPPVTVGPNMAQFDYKVNQHFTQREALQKLKSQFEMNLGKYELKKWKQSMEATIQAGQTPRIVDGADALIANRKIKVDLSAVMEIATNLLNQLAKFQTANQLDEQQRASFMQRLSDVDKKSHSAVAPPGVSYNKKPISAPIAGPQDSEKLSNESGQHLERQKPNSKETKSSANWDNLFGTFIWLSFLGMAVVSVLSIVKREKWDLTIYSDYTDAAMTICSPILAVIVFSVVANLFDSEWIAILASFGTLAFFEWRAFCLCRQTNSDLPKTLAAFITKQFIILAWFIAAMICFLWTPNKIAGETESEYRFRRREEGWLALVLMILLTMATAVSVKRLTRVPKFSSFWDYLRGQPTLWEDTESERDDNRDESENETEEDEDQGNDCEDEEEVPRGYPDKTENIPSPWEILGVTPDASQDEIKAAYRKRMQEYHPDLVANLGPDLRALAEEKAKEINEAYSTLKSQCCSK